MTIQKGVSQSETPFCICILINVYVTNNFFVVTQKFSRPRLAIAHCYVRYSCGRQKDKLKKSPTKGIFLIYLFDHCAAFLAFFKPNFLLSLALGSLFRNPSFFKSFLCSGFILMRILAIACLMASACEFTPPPITFTVMLRVSPVFDVSRDCMTITLCPSDLKYSLILFSLI